MSNEQNWHACPDCGGPLIHLPPRRLARRLAAWLLEGAPVLGQRHYRCPACDAEGSIDVLRFRPERDRPTALRVVRRLHSARRAAPVPVFYVAAVAGGGVAGALGRGLGAPAWSPLAAALGAAGAAWVGFLGSALEPGARWRTLQEAWLDEREGWQGTGVDRSTARRIREADFPLVGVADWQGARSVAGYGVAERFRVSSVALAHTDADAGRFVTVETSRERFDTQLEIRGDTRGRGVQGETHLTVDGRQVPLRRYPPAPHDRWDWAAAGEVGGVSIAVEVTGLDPAELALTSAVDPGPYLAGGR